MLRNPCWDELEAGLSHVRTASPARKVERLRSTTRLAEKNLARACYLKVASQIRVPLLGGVLLVQAAVLGWGCKRDLKRTMF